MTDPQSDSDPGHAPTRRALDPAPVSGGDDEALRAEVAALKGKIARLRQTRSESDRLARILEASPDFVGIATPDGKGIFINQGGAFSYVNQAALHLFGPRDTVTCRSVSLRHFASTSIRQP